MNRIFIVAETQPATLLAIGAEDQLADEVARYITPLIAYYQEEGVKITAALPEYVLVTWPKLWDIWEQAQGKWPELRESLETQSRVIPEWERFPDWKLSIDDPAQRAEAWGSEGYFMAWNDGFDFANTGNRLREPWRWARYRARAVGLNPVGYGSVFNEGYREAVRQSERT